jgi:hypothetical protein
MAKMRNENKITVGKPENRPKRKWKDNMKFTFREIGRTVLDWIQLAQGKVAFWAIVNNE